MIGEIKNIFRELSFRRKYSNQYGDFLLNYFSNRSGTVNITDYIYFVKNKVGVFVSEL